jgi:hypothetical protein
LPLVELVEHAHRPNKIEEEVAKREQERSMKRLLAVLVAALALTAASASAQRCPTSILF